jgi:hypothetical protein
MALITGRRPAAGVLDLAVGAGSDDDGGQAAATVPCTHVRRRTALRPRAVQAAAHQERAPQADRRRDGGGLRFPPPHQSSGVLLRVVAHTSGPSRRRADPRRGEPPQADVRPLRFRFRGHARWGGHLRRAARSAHAGRNGPRSVTSTSSPSGRRSGPRWPSRRCWPSLTAPVGVVDLEGDGSAGRLLEFGARRGTDPHPCPVEDVVDRQDRGPSFEPDGRPAGAVTSQHLNALAFGENCAARRYRSWVGPRSPRHARILPAAPSACQRWLQL